MQKNITKNNPQQADFTYKFYKVIMPKIYGIGAAIVILGAMFKLLNWAGGGFMLGLGLTTEAIIFILSAFEPQAKELDWTKAYPELKEGAESVTSTHRNQDTSDVSLSSKLDELFEKAQIDQQLLEKLSHGMQALAISTQHIANLANTAQATEQFTTNLEKASDMLANTYETQAGFLQAMQRLEGLSDRTQAFTTSLQRITTTLDTVNDTYAADLQTMSTKLQDTQAAHSGLADTMQQLQEAGNQIQVFREEMTQLSNKLASLNNVYGNMLTALKGQ